MAHETSLENGKRMLGKKPLEGPFSVLPYNEENLLSSLGVFANNFQTEKEIIDKNQHRYFKEYFKITGAQTIVIESEYVDHDFSEDYQAYYVRCHVKYDRTCVRLHFFREAFDDKELDSLLIGNNGTLSADKLQEGYIGFVVIKPLPTTIIGRTCLVTYKAPFMKGTPRYEERWYPITRTYDVSLFGIQLKVLSLAFQEQDRVASACATSALWSTFQGTGKLFQHAILSPVEITRRGSEKYYSEERILPNHGLSIEQMISAIRSNSLEVIAERFESEYSLLSKIYAYTNIGIPVVLIVDLVEDVEPIACHDAMEGKEKGLHAVAVTGYCLPKPKLFATDDTAMVSRAYGITKLYVHDDQVGPFARMEIDNVKVKISGDNSGKTYESLSTEWFFKGDSGRVRAIPHKLVIPIYHKIRIPFEPINAAIGWFHNVVFQSLADGPLIDEDMLPMWDITLVDVSRFKEDVRDDESLEPEDKRQLLTMHLPKYLWRAIAHIKGHKFLNLIFDATDIEQGPLLNTMVVYDRESFLHVQKFFIARKDVLKEKASLVCRCIVDEIVKPDL